MAPDVLRKLGSADARERLEAARLLSSTALPAQLAQIEAAFAVETVAWIRRALELALQRAKPNGKVKPEPIDQFELSAAQTAQIYSNALESTASQIIHEIEPILGTLRLSAESEILNFKESDTKRELDRLEALLAGLSRLRRAASAPKVEEVALDQSIVRWIEEEPAGYPIRILRAGPQGCVVEADKELIRLCFVNGLRNAIEATKIIGPEGNYPDITVNWGVTDMDAWITIVDSGIGFRGSLIRAFDIGSTTKSGHLGMGLATARQAMTSMDGSVELTPGDRGVRFQMRWPKAKAQSADPAG